MTEDDTATLDSCLAALELQLNDDERAERDAAAGMPVRHLVRDLVAAVDADTQAAELVDATNPQTAIQELLDTAIKPPAANPELRQRILELRATPDQMIDEVSVDLLDAYGVVDLPEPARSWSPGSSA